MRHGGRPADTVLTAMPYPLSPLSLGLAPISHRRSSRGRRDAAV